MVNKKKLAEEQAPIREFQKEFETALQAMIAKQTPITDDELLSFCRKHISAFTKEHDHPLQVLIAYKQATIAGKLDVSAQYKRLYDTVLAMRPNRPKWMTK